MEIVPSVEGTSLSTDLSYGDGHGRLEGHQVYHNNDTGYDSHIYEFNWTPDNVSFFIDDNLIVQYLKGDPYVDNQYRH